MGGTQAANVLATVKQDARSAAGQPLTPAEEDALRHPIIEQFEREGNAYYATARVWDDGIITPAETRPVLGLALAATLGAPQAETKFSVFRM